jgi:homoserine dehydrogenase
VIPIVRTIQESFGVTEIDKVFGIVNGTTNFILSEMAASGAGLRGGAGARQQLGYAEADPTEDVNGRRRGGEDGDPRPARLPHPGDARRRRLRGIEAIQPDDLAYAKELDLSLKLLGVAERRDGGISVRVFPCFLYAATRWRRSRARSTRSWSRRRRSPR